MEHAHQPRPSTIGSRTAFFSAFQHAPGDVDVQDLRPLRGRPYGPIPDTDAYPGAPIDAQKKIQQHGQGG
jgi:hypothetical protein